MGMAAQFQNGTLNPAQLKGLRVICIFFDKEARQHHLDEELHIFQAECVQHLQPP